MVTRPTHDGHVGCAAIAEALGEQLFGRGGNTRGWLLVETPGAWGKEPFAGHPDERLLRALEQRAAELPVRLLAIRRHGRSRTDGRTVFVAYSGPGRPWVERTTLAYEEALLGLDLAALADGQPQRVGEPQDTPIYLVCTQGSKDACCAVHGRPLAKALSAARPAETWECSHFGGDRFAGNLVCLPHGVYYGHVHPPTGIQIAEAYERGEVCLDHLRGRSCDTPVGQVADYFVRRETGLFGIDDVTVVDVETPSAGAGDVTLWAGPRLLRVSVHRVSTGQPRPTGCGSLEASDPGRWELVSITTPYAVEA